MPIDLRACQSDYVQLSAVSDCVEAGLVAFGAVKSLEKSRLRDWHCTDRIAPATIQLLLNGGWMVVAGNKQDVEIFSGPFANRLISLQL